MAGEIAEIDEVLITKRKITPSSAPAPDNYQMQVTYKIWDADKTKILSRGQIVMPDYDITTATPIIEQAGAVMFNATDSLLAAKQVKKAIQ